jgi:hypothetical protein
MAHVIEGYIAKGSDLRKYMERYKSPRFIPLENCDLVFMPITDEWWDELVVEPNDDQADFPIAYIRTNYCGGQGYQSATLWKDQKRIYAHTCTKGPINAALELMGVTKAKGKDEFETVGLNKYRRNNEWVENANYECVMAVKKGEDQECLTV